MQNSFYAAKPLQPPQNVNRKWEFLDHKTFGVSILRIEWMGFSNVSSQSLATGVVTREFLMLSPQVWIMFPVHHYPVAWYWSFSSPNTRNICLKLYFFFFSIEGNFLLTVGVHFIDNVNFCHSLDHAIFNIFFMYSESCFWFKTITEFKTIKEYWQYISAISLL